MGLPQEFKYPKVLSLRVTGCKGAASAALQALCRPIVVRMDLPVDRLRSRIQVLEMCFLRCAQPQRQGEELGHPEGARSKSAAPSPQKRASGGGSGHLIKMPGAPPFGGFLGITN